MPDGQKPARLILALDAAGDSCSAAIGRVGNDRAGNDRAGGDELVVLAQEKLVMKHGHAAQLVPMLERVADLADIALADLDLIAAGIGPGGFTGLRIALATARGLGLALDCPVIGISNFRAAAETVPADIRANLTGDILVLIDSRRDEPYLARLDTALRYRAAPRFMSLPEIAADIAAAPPALVTGDGTGLWPHPFAPGTVLHPAAGDALSILRLAADGEARYAEKPLPLYIREADVSKPKPAAGA
ncbi:tRNA (adenosine(37)-N6)-threonylcarbamoyltransferase complex dimerization subunit type 1 TsaB [Dongia sp.]|uniref:tRNA (adenosine(37)-N6)-threonylcarbamoyltransferase complex dimerization subunit type 1 TsaB n=1 Tax=Dongia sp. TaxID=1977262 RepID=UPI0035AECD13